MKRTLVSVFCIFISVCLCLGCCACSGRATVLLSAELLGSRLEVCIYGQKDDSILTQISDICKEADLAFSPTSSDSELYDFNASGGDGMTPSSDFLELLRLSLYYYALSDGKYDVTAHVLDELWDFDAATPSLPSDSDINSALAGVGMGNLSISANSASLANGATIDFGSLAKGYAIDKIRSALLASGADDATIKIDGNTVALGDNSGKGYTLTLPFPFAGNTETLGTVKISDRTAVTISLDSRYFRIGDTLYHDRLDPETGYPADTDLYSVTVFADTSVRAFALAEICIRLGLYDSVALISSISGVDAVFVTDSYSVRVTENFTKNYHPDFNRAYTEQIQ